MLLKAFSPDVREDSPEGAATGATVVAGTLLGMKAGARVEAGTLEGLKYGAAASPDGLNGFATEDMLKLVGINCGALIVSLTSLIMSRLTDESKDALLEVPVDGRALIGSKVNSEWFSCVSSLVSLLLETSNELFYSCMQLLYFKSLATDLFSSSPPSPSNESESRTCLISC